MHTYTTTNIVRLNPMTEVVAFPSAGNAVNMNYFDTDLITGRSVTTIALQASWPNLANHTNTAQNITIHLQHSANSGANWADLNPITEARIAGVANNGANADQIRLAFPAHLDQYVRAVVTVPASGPDVTGSNVTASLVFAS